MQTPRPESGETTTTASHTTLELRVRNHAGVMSQVCGLFARRGFNLEAILCRPEGDASESRIWLLLREEERLPQVLAQVRKLEDVLDAGPHAAAAAEFERAAAVFAGGPAQP